MIKLRWLDKRTNQYTRETALQFFDEEIGEWVDVPFFKEDNGDIKEDKELGFFMADEDER